MQLWQKIVLGAGAAIAGYWFFFKPKTANAGPGPLPTLPPQSCGKWEGMPARSPGIDELMAQTRLFNSTGQVVKPGVLLSPILVDGTIDNAQAWLRTNGFPQLDMNVISAVSEGNTDRMRHVTLLVSKVGSLIEVGETLLLAFMGPFEPDFTDTWQPGIPKDLFEANFDLYTLSCQAG
jgi:hypothetical protein